MQEKDRQEWRPSSADVVHAWSWNWITVPEWRRLFDVEQEIDWANLAESSFAELIKANDLRSVWRVRIGERFVVAKIYDPSRGWARFIARVKALLWGPPARREFRAALFGRSAGLSMIRPIAYGKPEASSEKGSYILLSEEITPATALSTYWSGSDNRKAKDVLIARLARFLEDLHSGLFFPTDLHPENILIRTDSEAPEPVLVDLHKSRFPIRVSKYARVSNLSDLNQWFQRNASRSDRLRFLLAYLAYAFDQPSRKVLRGYVEEIIEVSSWKTESLEKKRDKRIWGDNKYFGRLEVADGWRAHVFLQAKRPIVGSRCSTRRFSKSDWIDALEPLLNADGDADCDRIRIGSWDVPIDVSKCEDSPANLRDRWVEQQRGFNRHRAATLPLAFLERTAPGGSTAGMLIMERNDDGD